jgi:HK97 family phage portal protein
MSVLSSIRAHQRALIRAASPLAVRYPETADRLHIYSSMADRVQAESDDYAGYAQTYRCYVWVRKAISLIAQTLAPLPIRVVDSAGKPIANHPLTLLYAGPNDTMPGAELRALQLVHLLLGGERFTEIVDDARGRPVELWPRRPDRVGIRADESRHGYPAPGAYVLDDLATQTYDGTVDPTAVIHEKFANPLSEWRGLAPLSAVREGVQIAILAQAQRKLFYRNNARVEYAMTAAEALSPDERKRLEEQVNEKYGGGRGTGKPMILEFGQDIKSISYPPKDMTSLEDQQLSADEVAALFGVPDILMGFGNDSYDTEEKRDAALSVLWALTLVPLMQQFEQTETHFWTTIRPLLKSGQRIATDISTVAVLQDDIAPKLVAAKDLFALGVPFDLIDTRLRLNVGGFPGSGVGYLPAALRPLDQPYSSAPAPVAPPAPPKALVRATDPLDSLIDSVLDEAFAIADEAAE